MRVPQPLEFDMNNQAHVMFILAVSNLYVRILGMSKTISKAQIVDMLSTEPYASVADKEDQSSLDGSVTINNFNSILSSSSFETLISMFTKLNSVEELADLTNLKMDFILATVNLRSQNFGLKQATHFEVKMLMENIEPEIPSAAAISASIIGFEILKFVGVLLIFILMLL